MGTKYIIEVEDKPFELLIGDGFTSEKLFRVKGFNSLVFDWNGLNKLTPYTEPDDLEEVKKEAYDKCMDEAEMTAYKLYSPKIDEAYQRGLNDAWTAARKIAHCFLWGKYQEETGRSSACAQDVLDYYSAQEAIEEIRQHAQTQKEFEQEQEKEKPIRAEDVMRQYLKEFCKKHDCEGCVLNASDFVCGRVADDEEVRRAYAEVMKK